MGRRSRERAGWCWRARQAAQDVSGQSTVEYALVLLAFLAMLVGMGAVWHASREGRLADLAREAASHSMPSGVDVKLLQDVTAF